jgi:glycosyltransferase involved in cell wall biosynthesis
MVSIITPVFNGAATLRRACESVAAQTCSAWEHIIIDDGSTDETPEILDQIRTADPRVVTARIPNSGTSAALNLGVAKGRGEYVAFLDADDEYLPLHLASHVEFFEQHPDIDVLWGGAEVVGASESDLLIPDVEKGSGFVHISKCVLQGTIFVRRHVFSDFRFSEDRTVWYQDYVFIKQVSTKYKTAVFPLPTYRYYRNLGNSAIDRVKKHWTG